MSAQLDLLLRYRRMAGADLDAVVAIEHAVYTHPWTRGNFSDSLGAGYHCWIAEFNGAIAGYVVVMVGAGEAHLLNLSVAAPCQGRGLGRELLSFAITLARDCAARMIFLEVRPSNAAARLLYAAAGFTEVATRRGYYPAGFGREDAVVMQLDLH
jgi:[ribosomal protein S18]-alanine N-acetyltransferase